MKAVRLFVASPRQPAHIDTDMILWDRPAPPGKMVEADLLISQIRGAVPVRDETSLQLCDDLGRGMLVHVFGKRHQA
jgi:hypothetical protein